MSLFHPPKLLTASEYAHDLAHTIAGAKSEIALTVTMLRDDDPRSHAIVEALCEAADREVTISVCVDTFTYLEPKEFLLFSPKKQPARTVRALQLVRKLKHHGIQFRWLGRKANAIIYGRTHSKWAVVDNTVYSFGGANIDNESFENTDYMLRFTDARLALAIINEHVRVRRADQGGGAFRSHTYKLNDQTTVLFDGGFIGNSIIYRHACSLAKEAKKILFVSQYCPTGRLAGYLRKKDVKLYFNDGKNASLVNRILIAVGRFTAKHNTLYTREPYLHAKFIIFTMPDGHKVAISGSHNFMYGSGLVGTREIAIETTDMQIIRQLERFYKDHIA